MPVRPHKFTALGNASEFATWLGAVVQEKVAKENAGLVEINVTESKAGKPAEVAIRTSGSRYGFRLKIEPETRDRA